jgi:hypothetical protein
VLAHDLGERECLAAGLDRLAGPLLGMLSDGRVAGRPEDDALLLDAVAGEREGSDTEGDDGDSEQDQHAAREVSTDSQELSVSHRILLCHKTAGPHALGDAGEEPKLAAAFPVCASVRAD